MGTATVTHGSYIPPKGALMKQWEDQTISGNRKKGKKRIDSPTQYANEHEPVGRYK